MNAMIRPMVTPRLFMPGHGIDIQFSPATNHYSEYLIPSPKEQPSSELPQLAFEAVDGPADGRAGAGDPQYNGYTGV